MKHLLITLIILLLSCEKDTINTTSNTSSVSQSKTLKVLYFVNSSQMSSLSYTAKKITGIHWEGVYTGCSIPNYYQAGVLYFLKSHNDTICSFKISNTNIISWKNHPPHYVSLGGCTTNSLKIYE